MQGSKMQSIYCIISRRHIKATPDNEFVIYIKDLKSQCHDGRGTFIAEDLMARPENKYEARLLDEENTWGKPTEEQ